MKDLKRTCRIAVVQAAPVLFDKTACTDKAVRLIAECAQQGAELIVFPELFIPGYPYGMTFGFTVGARNEDGRKDWQLYCDNSIVVPGPETERLAAAAKAAGSYVSIGVSERDGVTGTLYNANLIFCPDGTLAPVHRKLEPTGADSVDFKLVNLVHPGDIVVTQDYGLAAMCLGRGAVPIHQDGMVYTDENIDSLLFFRAAAQKVRRGGGRLKGPARRTKAQNHAFEAALQKLLQEAAP